MSEREKIEMMLKQTADTFRDNEQILLRSETEEVVTKFSTSKKIKGTV